MSLRPDYEFTVLAAGAGTGDEGGPVVYVRKVGHFKRFRALEVGASGNDPSFVGATVLVVDNVFDIPSIPH